MSSTVGVNNATYSASNNLNAGSYTQTASSVLTGNDAANYTLVGGYTTGSSNYVVNQASISIQGTQVYNGSIIVYGNALTAAGVAGETFAVTGQANMLTKNVQTNQSLSDVIGLHLTPLNGASSSNYLPLDVSNTSVSVTARPVTLTAPSISKVYDGGFTYALTAADLTAMSASLVGGDLISSASVAFAGNNANAGSNKTVTLSGALITNADGTSGSANYAPTYVNSNNSQITQAPLLVTVKDASKFVTEADVAGYNGVRYGPFVNGETASVLGGALAIVRSGLSSGTNTAGTYALTASGLTSANYSITYAPGVFTIIPANQLKIDLTSVTTTYGSTPASYSATAQYLTCSLSDCSSSGSVNVIHTLNPTITGNSFYVADNAGGSASFTISAALPVLSSSHNLVIGSYSLVPTGISVTSNNFNNTIILSGALTVIALPLSSTQLGITGVSKVYDGNNAISNLTLNTSSVGSLILPGDSVSIFGTGTYANANAGNNKSVTISVGLTSDTGNDYRNYVLSSNQITANIGTITPLATATYVGAAGGDWSVGTNWRAGAPGALGAYGATPTLNNVTNVIIPTGFNVNFNNDALVGLLPTSTITNNGVLGFSSLNAFTFTNNVSGVGSINQSGAGVLTIAGNNSYSGGTYINSSSLMAGSVNALGTGPVISAGGSFSSAATLPNLTINGPVTLGSNIATVDNQTYNGAVTLGGGNTMVLQSANGNVSFNSTLLAGPASYTSQQSLSISAPNGQVTFGDTVGGPVLDGSGHPIAYSNAYFQSPNIYDLTVNANTILIKGNITTFATQDYTGHVLIGGRGNTDLTRILLSEDPSIVFHGAIDDTVANTHNLVVEAIATVQNQTPIITFAAPVGAIDPLASLTVKTGTQNPTSYITDISAPIGNIGVMANVTTAGNQAYTANEMTLGDSTLPTATLTFTTKGGVITFNIGSGSGSGNGISSNSNSPVGFALQGGSVVGLSGSGLSYRTDIVSSAVTNGSASAAVIPTEGITTGILLAAIDTGKEVEYIQFKTNVKPGSVSITSPDEGCKSDMENCFKARLVD